MGGKRKRSGTGDTYPQWLVFSMLQSATTTTATIPMPIAPYQQSGMVMEILKVWYELGNSNLTTAATGATINLGLTTRSAGMAVTDNAQGSYLLADPYVLFYKYIYWPKMVTSGVYSKMESEIIDLTDGMGHGQFVVTPNLYLTISTGNATTTNVVRMRLLYRTRKMPLNEYLGFFQAQQPAN